MLKKFLKDIVAQIAGKPSEGIIDMLDGKKYINEYLIAKKLNLTVNQTRNILYKISDFGLVSFIRKKDKRKGWYTYSWKLEILKCLEFLKGEIAKKIDQLLHQIKSRETKEFYICETCNIEYNEETALIHNFMCNECGNVVSRRDNAPVIKEYNRALDKLKRELTLVETEFNLEKGKLEKIKIRGIKKEERIKKEAKDSARKLRQSEKKKISNNNSKSKKEKKKVSKLKKR